MDSPHICNSSRKQRLRSKTLYGYFLSMLSFKQIAIGRLKKAMSLMCIRCSYSICLSRENTLWRLWKTGHCKIKPASFHGWMNSAEKLGNIESSDVFCDFDEVNVKEAQDEQQEVIHFDNKIAEKIRRMCDLET